MPHLDVYALDSDLTGREAPLIEGLTGAVVAVYGEWAREGVVVRLIGVPHGRWGVGGRAATAAAPTVTFGIREAAFSRPDAPDVVARLIGGVTDAIVAVLGEPVRAGLVVDLVAEPAGRTGVGGVVA